MNSSINKNLAVKIIGKKLSETTLEELWKLFPIYLTEHQSCWQEWYSEEEGLLKNALPSVKRISHIGSTALCHAGRHASSLEFKKRTVGIT